MKYLTKELYMKCFYANSFDDNEDKFLIGYLNKEENKLKDVISGQIVDRDNYYFSPISRLKSFGNGGNQMALGYMTGLRAANASVRQLILAQIIDSYLSKEVIDENQIIKIKNIMNREIKRNHEKEIKKNNLLNEKEKKLNTYSIDESERNF